MAKFQVEWSKDHVEIVEQSDCQTVEQFINCRFGGGKKPLVKVTLVKEKGEKTKDAR